MAQAYIGTEDGYEPVPAMDRGAADPEPKWEPIWTLVFVAGSSIASWGAIIFAVYQLI